jgi:SAM-dependent methyltransferase
MTADEAPLKESEPTPHDWYLDFFKDSWLEAQAALKGAPELTALEVDWLIERLGLQPGARVLDVPCGTGRHAVELASRGYTVLGVDVSPEVLAAAAERIAEAGVTSLELRQGDMRDLPRKAAFDGAFCWWGSFGYLGDEGDAAFFAAVAGSLKPGSRFALDVVPLEAYLSHHAKQSLTFSEGVLVGEIRRYDHRTGRNEAEFHHVTDGRHAVRHASIRIYSCPELLKMLETAGFEDVEFHADLEGTPWQLGAGRCHLLATRR